MLLLVFKINIQILEQLSAIPEFAHLGPLFKSSAPIDLTEADVEYNVKCIKHTFSNYIVFQFDCVNTLNDQLLEKVTIRIDSSDGHEVISYKPCPKLAYNSPGVAYALVRLADDPTNGKIYSILRLCILIHNLNLNHFF